MNYHTLQYENDAIPLCPHKKETRGKWLVFIGYDGFGLPYFESEDHIERYCISQVIISPKKAEVSK